MPARSYVVWINLVDEFMRSLGGVTTDDLSHLQHPYGDWWATGCSPKWAAREALSMDNG